MVCPLWAHTGHVHVNVGFLDASRGSHLLTFWPEGGRVLHWEGRDWSQKSAKIGEANGMPSLPTGPTQVTKTGNLCSVDFSRRPIFSHLALGFRVLHWESREWSKKIRKNGKANGMPSPPTGPHRSQKRKIWVLFSGRPIYSQLALGSRVMRCTGN